MRKEKESDIEVIIKAMVLFKIPRAAITPVVTWFCDKMMYQNLGQDDVPWNHGFLNLEEL